MRPSTSMQAQLRPISPSPPRKTTRTGFGLLRSAKRGDRDRGSAERGEDLGRLGVELGGGRAHRQAALADLVLVSNETVFDRYGVRRLW